MQAGKLKSQGWTPIYMIIVIIIAVILLMTFFKPLFNNASNVQSQVAATTQQVLHSIALSLS